MIKLGLWLTLLIAILQLLAGIAFLFSRKWPNAVIWLGVGFSNAGLYVLQRSELAQ